MGSGWNVTSSCLKKLEQTGGNDMIEIAPSILAADVLNLGQDVQRVLDGGAAALHVDVMDAHFVPNLTFGPHLVSALRNRLE